CAKGRPGSFSSRYSTERGKGSRANEAEGARPTINKMASRQTKCMAHLAFNLSEPLAHWELNEAHRSRALRLWRRAIPSALAGLQHDLRSRCGKASSAGARIGRPASGTRPSHSDPRHSRSLPMSGLPPPSPSQCPLHVKKRTCASCFEIACTKSLYFAQKALP